MSRTWPGAATSVRHKSPLKLSVLALLVTLSVAIGLRTSEPARGQVANRPNVLVIVTDDQREGLEVMPETRQWFAQGGTYYPNAIATTPMCCPARAAILSGRYAHNNGVTRNSNAKSLDQSKTMEAYLQKAGYTTGIFGKFFNSIGLSIDPRFFDTWATFPNSQNHYIDGYWNVQGTVKLISQYATDYIGTRAVEFIRSNAGRPWFLYLATPAAHTPMTAQANYAQASVPQWDGNPAVFESDRSDKPPWVQAKSQSFSSGRSQRTKQYRTLMSVDDMVSRIAAALSETGQGQDTLAFFISDNGYMWSEHKLPGKGWPYMQSIGVSMLSRWPGHISAGERDGRLVANIDIAPTVLDAAGVVPDVHMDGRSLLGDFVRDRILAEYWAGQPKGPPPWAARLTRTDEYVEYYDPSTGSVTFREYYDLVADPWQLSNLRTPPAGAQAELDTDRRCAGAGCP